MALPMLVLAGCYAVLEEVSGSRPCGLAKRVYVHAQCLAKFLLLPADLKSTIAQSCTLLIKIAQRVNTSIYFYNLIIRARTFGNCIR